MSLVARHKSPTWVMIAGVVMVLGALGFVLTLSGLL
jgi:hypothetical protein